MLPLSKRRLKTVVNKQEHFEICGLKSLSSVYVQLLIIIEILKISNGCRRNQTGRCIRAVRVKLLTGRGALLEITKENPCMYMYVHLYIVKSKTVSEKCMFTTSSIKNVEKSN